MNGLEIRLKELCSSGKCGLCCFFPIPNERIEEIESLNFKIKLHFRDDNHEFVFYVCKYLDVVIDEEKNEIKTMLCSIYPKKGEKDKRSIVCGANTYPVWVKKSGTCYPSLEEISVWINDKNYSINKGLESIEHQRRKGC